MRPPSASRTSSISIHALREEGDQKPDQADGEAKIFLSTPSARRATWQRNEPRRSTTDFYPRPPRGGRRPYFFGAVGMTWISIHALREEGDEDRFYPGRLDYDFYPRPPRGGRPAERQDADPPAEISIHALREEGDQVHLALLHVLVISIHALREEGDPLVFAG